MSDSNCWCLTIYCLYIMYSIGLPIGDPTVSYTNYSLEHTNIHLLMIMNNVFDVPESERRCIV